MNPLSNDPVTEMHAMLATLERQQIVHASIEAVWDFFSTPKNLDLLTPPDLRFFIVSPLPKRMEQGQLIEYRVGILPGVRLRWLTEIRHVREREFFVDEQRIGPYRLWYHEHRFEPTVDGIRVRDRVTYAIGWGPIGWLADKWWVRRKLNRVFDYRNQVIADIFERTPTAASPGTSPDFNPAMQNEENTDIKRE